MEKGIKRKNNDGSTNEPDIIDNNKQKKTKSDNVEESSDELRILEFFCGIGGMVKMKFQI